MNRKQLSRWLNVGEDAIYLVAAVLLGVASLLILLSTGEILLDALRSGEIVKESIHILDSLLLVLLIVEIMHTIRVSIVEHALIAEPFLVVALIAGVRRVLILTAEADELLPNQPEQFDRVITEMWVLIALFVVLVAALAVLRRLGGTPGKG